MDKHLNTSRAHFALACLYGVILLLLALMVIPKAGAEGVLVLTLFLAPFLFHLLVAKGARDGKSWARRGSKGIGCLMLLGFPVGTLIGAYLLANAWSDWMPPKRSIGLTEGWPGQTADNA